MKTVRILSILFLLFCLAFVFASCDNERPQENAETEKTAETGQETGLGGLRSIAICVSRGFCSKRNVIGKLMTRKQGQDEHIEKEL